MLNISFAITTQQTRDRIKTETRRDGWLWIVKHFEQSHEPVYLRGVVKGQGLPKGSHPERITCLRVNKAWREPLNFITDEAVAREGFPGQSANWFMEMYCNHNGGTWTQDVTVIQFVYPWQSKYGIVWADSLRNAQLQLSHSTANMFKPFNGEILLCKTCGAECTDRHWMCDRNIKPVWCRACFDRTPCGRGKHGEDCPTLVANCEFSAAYQPVV